MYVRIKYVWAFNLFIHSIMYFTSYMFIGMLIIYSEHSDLNVCLPLLISVFNL